MRKLRNRFVVLIGVIGLLAAPAMAGAVGGFDGPIFGIDGAPGGKLLVADASAGVHTIKHGVVVSTVALPGATDASSYRKNSFWATTTGFDPETDSGQAVWRVVKGEPEFIANLFSVEAKRNPHPTEIDSNPFDVEALNRSKALVADAGGNDLLRVNKNGNVKVLAVFPDELVSTANIKSLAGCPEPAIPDLAFACELPDFMPAEAVPTSIAVGPDGYYYVGELKGFPGPTGESNIWRVAPNASWENCPSVNCVKVFDGGFTSIIDLAFGDDGRLYVAELDEQSWAAVEIFQSGVGGTINSCDVSTLSCYEVAGGIPMLTSIAFASNGKLWATQNSLIPGLAEVFKVG